MRSWGCSQLLKQLELERCKTGGCLPCTQTQEGQQRRVPPICTMMTLHSSSCMELEQRHLPPLMQSAHSTKKLEADQHRRGGQMRQPLLAMKGQVAQRSGRL